MKARMPAGFGRPDMNALMRQAQKMQDDMKAKQAELEAAEYTGSASGEMVTVKMNGKHEVLSISKLFHGKEKRNGCWQPGGISHNSRIMKEN